MSNTNNIHTQNNNNNIISITPEQKKLVLSFKQFVQKALIPQLKSTDSAITEWQYFCSMISQDTIDYGKLQVYLQVLGNSNNIGKYSQGNTNFGSGSNLNSRDDMNLGNREVNLHKTNSNNSSGLGSKKKQQGNQGTTGGITTTNNFVSSRQTFGGQRSRFNMLKFNFDEGVTIPKLPQKDFTKKQDKQKSHITHVTSPLNNSNGQSMSSSNSTFYTNSSSNSSVSSKLIGSIQLIYKTLLDNQHKLQTGINSSTKGPQDRKFF